MADASQLAADSPLLREIESVFAAHLTGDLLEAAMLPEVFNVLVGTLQGSTREEILQVASDATALLVERATDSTKRGIAQLLFESLDAQYGVDKTARLLRDSIGLTPQQVKSLAKFEGELTADGGFVQEEIDALLGARRQELINERAKSIAKTEMRNAVETGEHMVATSRGMTHKVNVDSGDSKVSDICRECSAAGPIPIDSDFPSGRQTAPHHPNCRCSTKYSVIATGTELDAAKRRADERVNRIDTSRRAATEIQQNLAL